MPSRYPSPLVTALLAFAVPASAAAEIVRCAEADGRVTYQEIPCSGSSMERRLGIPTEFPAPNLAERDRLFAREAALDRRLEARRDRELQEAAMRAAREEREAERLRIAALEAQQPQYVLAYPLPYWRPGPVRRPHNATQFYGRPAQASLR